MRPFWNGSISFGLINIPVQVISAAKEENLGFSMVHAKDNAKIHYKKVCERGHEVDNSQIVKAYEMEDGALVVLTDDDFRRASLRKTSTLDVLSFINPSEVGAAYFEKPYYLAVGKNGEESYALLHQAMEASKTAALVRYVFRNHESVGMIVPHGRGLILLQLRYHFQLREDENDYPKAKAKPRELTIALALIKKLGGKFRPGDYKDTYRDDLKRLIAAKAKGVELQPAEDEPIPTSVIDLMSMLRKSLGQKKRLGDSSEGGATPTRARASKLAKVDKFVKSTRGAKTAKVARAPKAAASRKKTVTSKKTVTRKNRAK